MERKITFKTLLLLFSVSTIWGGASEAVTSLVGRNAEGYLGPIGTILGTDMNSGFYRKASPHKILGFDFTFDIVYAMAPVGQTTYNFHVPDDSIEYTFPFQFPKSLLSNDLDIINAIPNDVDSDNNALYQDHNIDFKLLIRDILEAPTSPVQNILGTSECPDGDNDPTTDD